MSKYNLRKISILISGVWISIAVVMTSCDRAGNQVNELPNESAIPRESPDAFVQASELFVKSKCISCHGAELQGRVGEATNLQKVGARRSIEEIKTKIASGGNGMPSYASKLDDEQITLLAEWLATKR